MLGGFIITQIIYNYIVFKSAFTDDVADYYQTKVESVTPLDALKEVDLPPNLHVQYTPHRFHPGKLKGISGPVLRIKS